MIKNSKTRLKFISILGSVFLWIFVMVVVDPSSSITIEGVPITISNSTEIADNSLMVDTSNELKTNISLSGKLSILRKVSRDNIRVSAEVSNPSEGKNIAYLSAITPNNTTYKLSSDSITVELDRHINEDKEIKIATSTEVDTSGYKITLDDNIVNVSGSRKLVKSIDTVIANIPAEFFEKESYEAGVSLICLDSNRNEISNVVMDKNIVNVKINKLERKLVPIKLIFEDSNINASDFALSNTNIEIKGEKDVISKIEFISTKPIKNTEMKNLQEGIPVTLDIPSEILIDDTGNIIIKNIKA